MNWPEIAAESELLMGKRLSEIAKITLSDYVIMTDRERAIAARTLATACLQMLQPMLDREPAE